MPLEPALISYAALASMALAVKKHRPAPPLPFMPVMETARWIGWMLLASALVVAVLRFGTAQGIAAWVGQMCVAGGLLVLMLSWRPGLAFGLSAPALGGALLSILI